MDPDNYGPMLIPVVMSKLPENLKLNITRQFGQDLWDIKLILESFKNELAVLEKINLTKVADKDKFKFNTASGNVCILHRVSQNLVVLFVIRNISHKIVKR